MSSEVVKSSFDAKTAKRFVSNVAGSRHSAYRDAQGAIALLCESFSDGGRVAVSEAALNWLRELKGFKVVRLINGKSDVTVPLDQLPEKPVREGRYGPFRVFELRDFSLGSEGGYPPLPEQMI